MKKIKLFSLIAIASILCSTAIYAQSAWTQKNSLTSIGRFGGVSFSIGTKGYSGTGNIASGSMGDFWEFDPTTNSWTQKANVGNFPRYQATGFSLNGKGYIGMGDDSTGMPLQDFWEYNPGTNTWTAKANYPGGPRDGVASFAIGNKGYAGTGGDLNSTVNNDFFEYNPANDTWTAKASFGGTPRFFATGFAIGNMGYLGTGDDYTGSLSDFYRYDPATDAWTQVASCDANGERVGASSFVIGNKGYLTFGENYNERAEQGHKDLWEYDPTNDSWTVKEDFPGIKRSQGTAFSVGSKGYAGTGITAPGFENDVYEFDPLYCNTVPTTPVITGPTVVCTVLHPVYVAVATGSSSYTWTVPSGITITSGQGTGSIRTTVAAGTVSGLITCVANNACGSSTVASMTVSKKPPMPGAITGPVNVCGMSSATYSIASVFGATSYSWTVPAGMTIMSGTGTTSINVSIANTLTQGVVKVMAVNACGSVPGATLAVYGKAAPNVINGPTNVCGMSTVTYSTPTIPNATGYSWVVPPFWTFTGQGTNNILVTLPVNVNNVNYTGLVRVHAISACGISADKTMSVGYCKSALAINNGVSGVVVNSVFPNPAHSEFTIDVVLENQESTIDNQQLTLEMYDVLGNKVIHEKHSVEAGENAVKTNIEQLQKGMYFVRVVDADNNVIHTERIVKQ